MWNCSVHRMIQMTHPLPMTPPLMTPPPTNQSHNDEYKTKYNSTENSCYLGLFMSCKSLIKAPDLVASSLSKSCYMSMFHGCTNLKYIKCLATDISASNCTFEWVWGVASKGNFYTPASTNWTTDISGIPQGWTRHDIT